MKKMKHKMAMLFSYWAPKLVRGGTSVVWLQSPLSQPLHNAETMTYDFILKALVYKCCTSKDKILDSFRIRVQRLSMMDLKGLVNERNHGTRLDGKGQARGKEAACRRAQRSERLLFD